ncbi:MAG: hypothetical protein Q9212_003271 [Teloschistes hypoglaucus]
MAFSDLEHKLENDDEAASSPRYQSPDHGSISALFTRGSSHQDKRPFEWKPKYSNAVLVITNIVFLSTLPYLIVRCQSLAPKADVQHAFANLDPFDTHAARPIKSADPVVGVEPIPCHSHNDYTQPNPLHDALEAGCISVEADIWLQDNDLFIAHEQDALDPPKTLKSLYIDPITKIIQDQNVDIDLSADEASSDAALKGVFTANSSQPLTLLIDIKTDSGDTLPVLMDQLSFFRSSGLLTHFTNHLILRPLTIVLSGNTAFSSLPSLAPNHDIFFDAPLDTLSSSLQYTTQNSYYASVSFSKTIGKTSWLGDISDEQMKKIKEQIQEAHERGLKVRYWDTPGGAFEKQMWGKLWEAGADVVNVNDLEGARDFSEGK